MSGFCQLPALEGGAGGGCQPRKECAIRLAADTHPCPSLKGGERRDDWGALQELATG